MIRREYSLRITINGITLSRVLIDPHYEVRHSRSINDDLILQLVKLLDGHYYDPETTVGSFEYFVEDGLALNGKLFKLIWVIERGNSFLGVINAYRRK